MHTVESVYCGHLGTDKKCPYHQGVLIFQVILYDKEQFGTSTKCVLGLGDIEIMQCDYCSKRHYDYCYIALEHFAVVNRAEHHPTSVS